MNQLAFGGVVVTAPPLWADFRGEFREEFKDTDVPFTLARADQNGGSLQFSLGFYESGPVPDFRQHLDGFLADFASTRQLGAPLEAPARGQAGPVAWLGSSYRMPTEDVGDTFVRVWYVSDGPNAALVTYVAPWDMPGRAEELAEAEAIVQSLRFESSSQAVAA